MRRQGDEEEGRRGTTDPGGGGSSIPSTLCADKALFKGLFCIIRGGAHKR